MNSRIPHILFILVLYSCSGKYTPRILTIPFSEEHTPSAPDYSDTANWAALPFRLDNADRVPGRKRLHDEQQHAGADVFFIHPTLYVDTTPISNQWNASVTDEKINRKVDESTILYQASVFNGAEIGRAHV